MTTYHNDITQGSDEWLTIRLGKMTASLMSKLITPTGKVASNKDSRAIVYEKLGERLTGDLTDSFQSYHMERGNIFEPFARDLYSSERAPVTECGFVTREFDGFTLGYSPDGLVGDDGLIEIKCPTQYKHIKEMCEGLDPKDAMMQIQTGLLVTDREWCDFISHYNGMHQRIVRVTPNLELHDKIKEACRNLEECIKENRALYIANTEGMPKADFVEGVAI